MALADVDNTGLIQRAYVRFADGRPHPTGIVPTTGGAAWIRSELFDIDARLESSPNEEMMQGPMLRHFSKTDLNSSSIAKPEKCQCMR
jgi:hypothetical protein